MNALLYLSRIEIECSNKDNEYTQNVAHFIRHLLSRIKKDSEIEEKYLSRIRELIIKHGVDWGVNHRKIRRIAKWINSNR